MSINNVASRMVKTIPGLSKGVDGEFTLLLDLDKIRLNLSSLRVLGFLFDDYGQIRGHTKSQIADKLHLWEDRIDEILTRLTRQGLIHTERVSYGISLFRRRRTIRVYHLTELGRFLLHRLDMQFPGLWLTHKRMET